MSVEELIARLEAATHPSRALDLMICRVALNSEPLGHAAGMTDDMLLSYNPFGPFPHYTLSIDAALTLVPDNDSPELPGKWRWALAWPAYVDGVWQPGKHRADIHHPLSSGGGPRWVGLGATPAIALCIAALRARAAA
jgi:hypothetical protein